MDTQPAAGERSSEAGFTLVEATVAILILIVGLAAVTNLILVAATNNQAANKMNGTAVAAAEALEDLKAQPYAALALGGSLTANVDDFFEVTDTPESLGAGGLNEAQGVGKITTRWWIQAAPGAPGTLFITVQAMEEGPLSGGIRSRTTYTTLRAP